MADRDLFQDVVDPSVKVGDRSFRSLPVSVLLHAVGAVVIVVVALTAGDMLPSPPVVLAFVAPVISAPPPPPPPPAPPVAAAPRPTTTSTNPAAAPVAAPVDVKPESGLQPPAPAGAPGGVEGGIPGGAVGAGPVTAPEPPAPSPSAQAGPLRVGGNVKAPLKTKDVRPVYPTFAARARVQGVVIIEAVIGTDGRVKDAHVLRSIPILDQAALDAVRQWEYTPTLFDGAPHAVVMVVTVTFQLGTTGMDLP